MGTFANIRVPDDDLVVEAARDTLTRPADTWWANSDMFVTWAPTIARTRDADLAGISNFERLSDDMLRTFPADCYLMRASDALFGWRDLLAVRVLEPWADPDDYAARDITRAFKVVMSVAVSLRDQYPLYDDTDYSERVAQKRDERREEAWEYVCHELWLEHDIENGQVTAADRAVYDELWVVQEQEYGPEGALLNVTATAAEIARRRGA